MSNLIEEPVNLESPDRYALPPPTSAPDEGPHCPTVFLDNPIVVDLPKCAYVTFLVKRGPKTVVEASKRAPASASATLYLKQICKVEECDEEDEPEDKSVDSHLDDILKELAG
jgi:hypothetical protein